MLCSPFLCSFQLKIVSFQITPLSIKLLKLKCSADQILTMKPDFVSLDHLRVAIRSFSNNWYVYEPAN